MTRLKILMVLMSMLSANIVFSNVKVDSLTMEPFGKLHIYVPDGTIESVSIMISGDGGWQFGVLDYAKHFAQKNSLIIGVDILEYYKILKSRTEDCYHIFSDFIELATKIEKKYNLKNYQEPLLMGYSSGATMVYALLAQAPPETFTGGISIGFCPDVELPKHFCELNGLKQHPMVNGKGFDLNPDSELGNRWMVLNGKLDQVCTYQDTAYFISKCSDSQLITLDKVGHGFSHWQDFMPQWDVAFQELVDKGNKGPVANFKAPNNNFVAALPIILNNNNKENEGNSLLFFISGDGGWYNFEQNVSDRFLNLKIPTIGLDAKKYFWRRKTPQQAADDISALLQYYMNSWNRQKVIFLGYSIGAEVLPFIFEKLPKDIQECTSGMVLLSPDEKGDFEVHISNMLGIDSKDNTYDVIKELKTMCALTSIKIIYGGDEKSPLPNELSKYKINFSTVPGNHHYNNDYKVIFDAINKAIN